MMATVLFYVSSLKRLALFSVAGDEATGRSRIPNYTEYVTDPAPSERLQFLMYRELALEGMSLEDISVKD
jgi:hypothetical protein